MNENIATIYHESYDEIKNLVNIKTKLKETENINGQLKEKLIRLRKINIKNIDDYNSLVDDYEKLEKENEELKAKK